MCVITVGQPQLVFEGPLLSHFLAARAFPTGASTPTPLPNRYLITFIAPSSWTFTEAKSGNIKIEPPSDVILRA
ncbi:MAG: hypothetical protein H0U18_15785 [Pyrinomonadaceae bacterium]|nr:hypothetical protein [Pyrinomonadaceae bacterium]